MPKMRRAKYTVETEERRPEETWLQQRPKKVSMSGKTLSKAWKFIASGMPRIPSGMKEPSRA